MDTGREIKVRRPTTGLMCLFTTLVSQRAHRERTDALHISRDCNWTSPVISNSKGSAKIHNTPLFDFILPDCQKQCSQFEQKQGKCNRKQGLFEREDRDLGKVLQNQNIQQNTKCLRTKIF